MKRRTVLWLGLGTAGALAAGWAVLPPRQRLTGGADRLTDIDGFTPNAWISIAADDSVTIFMPRAEMGQGTHTGLAMLLAEELGCSLANVRIAAAPIASVYANLAVSTGSLPMRDEEGSTARRIAEHFSLKFARELGFMVTGGSTSIADLWVVLREAGATAREALRQAAARQWSAPLAECRIESAQVVHADGRRLSYGQVVATAAQHLEAVDDVALKNPSAWTLIGTRAPRLEAKEKITGQALFAADLHEPGMLYAELGFSPYRDGVLRGYDQQRVRAMPGVVEVLEVPSQGGSAPALVVLAEQRWQAWRALEAAAIEWAPGVAGAFEQSQIDEALRAGLRADAEVTVHRDEGEAASIIAKAESVVRAEYEVPHLAHAAMEPLACSVKFEGERATVWAGVQIQDAARKAAAAAFGLDPEQVTLVPMLLGGGFGRRLEADFVAIAATIGRAAPGRLVQVLWRREADMRNDFYRPAVRARLAAAVEVGAGLIAALESHSAGQSVMAQALPRQLGVPAYGPDKSNVEGAFDQAYEIPHHRVVHATVELPVPVGFWRSVGHSQQAFFQESFMDELALSAGADPVDFRLRHLAGRPRHQRVLREAASRANWASAPAAAADGQPVARGVALHESFGSIVAAVAEVSRSAEGRLRVHRVVTAIDCGVAVNPNLIEQQMESAVVFGLSAALYGRISFAGGQVEQGNFDGYPLLRLADCPAIETWVIPSPEHPGGVGEPGVPPVAPAVANALARLTGRRERRLPLPGA